MVEKATGEDQLGVEELPTIASYSRSAGSCRSGPGGARANRYRVSGRVAGLALAGLWLLGLVVATRQSGEESSDSPKPPRDREEEVFYREASRSLTPFLTDVNQLSTLLREVSSGTLPDPSVSQAANRWADNFTTASRAVGRVHVPSRGRGREARELYQMGAALYAESARAVQALVAVAREERRRDEALKAVRRLQLLGDRTMDAGTRLLDRGDVEGSLGVQLLLPPAVPNFAEEGLSAGTAQGAPPSSPGEGNPGEPVTPDRWIAGNRDAIVSARRVLNASIPWLSTPGAASEEAIRAGADALEHLSRTLGRSPLAPPLQEGVHQLRLALLVAAESLWTVCPNDCHRAANLTQGRRLRLIADQVWDLGADVLVSGHAGTRSLYHLAPTRFDR